MTLPSPFISCLMATHGRHGRACESLACFLNQDYPDRELVILNSHPVPLVFDHPLVRIYNEGAGFQTLGHCRNRLLELARGPLVKDWDDDDLNLPHSISLGVQMIGDHPAWKPSHSWFMNGGEITLAANSLEGSITWRTDAVRAVGYANTAGTEHDPLLTGIKIAEDDVGAQTPFIYRWGCGGWHLSGSIGSGTEGQRTKTWREMNQDVKPDVPLMPADLSKHWARLAEARKRLFPDPVG